MYLNPEPITPLHAVPEIRPISIMGLLHWAFATECAQLNFDDPFAAGLQYGLEYVLIERRRLGISPDGGGRSAPHDEAALVADCVLNLPEARGGRDMAIQIAELARRNAMPDAMVDARTRCEPSEWRMNQYSRFAKECAPREIGLKQYPDWQTVNRSGRVIRHKSKCCPVTYIDHPRSIIRARINYLMWRGALLDLRMDLAGQIKKFHVTQEMPPVAPWKTDKKGNRRV